MYNIRTVLLMFFLGTGISIFAQKDSSKKQVIDITSSFKPTIRNTPKVNFSATNLTIDTSKSIAPYSIPSLNLLFSYHPVSLKPLALNRDSASLLGLRNFIKLGYGSLSTPSASTSLSLGEGIKSLVSLTADYISSIGAIENQYFAQFNTKLNGSYFSKTNEIFGVLGLNRQDYRLYGYNHSLLSFSKQAVMQNFENLHGKIGIRNTIANDLGINYSPVLEVNHFNNQHKLGENSMKLDIPIEKSLEDFISVKLSVKADLNSYTTQNLPENTHFNNTLLQLLPAVTYKSKSLLVNLGMIPAWDDGTFSLLPNFYGETKINQLPVLFQAGYTGQFFSNSYRNLSVLNPYLHPVLSQRNTKETAVYVGFKSSAGKHFNFSAQFSYVKYNQLPLYINDTSTDEKAFLINYESSLQNLQYHADISFVNADRLSLTSGITLNNYNKLKDHLKAWGTIPFEIINSLRWKAFEKLLLKADSRFFGGGPYLMKNNIQNTLANGADVSLGAEFFFNKKFSAWMDANNILNNKYERWHNYQVYGFQIIGGFIVKF